MGESFVHHSVDVDSTYTLTPADLALLTLLLRTDATKAFAPNPGVQVTAAAYARALGISDTVEAWRELVHASSMLYTRQISSKRALTGSVRRVRWVVELSQTNIDSTCTIALNPSIRDFLLKLIGSNDLDLARVTSRYTVRLAEMVRNAAADGQSSVEKTIPQIESALGFIALGTRFRTLRSRVLEPAIRDFNETSRLYTIRQFEVTRTTRPRNPARIPTHIILRFAPKEPGMTPVLQIIDDYGPDFPSQEYSPSDEPRPQVSS